MKYAIALDIGGTSIKYTLVNQNGDILYESSETTQSKENYNPQNEMFRLFGTKRSFSQNETFFFPHP